MPLLLALCALAAAAAAQDVCPECLSKYSVLASDVVAGQSDFRIETLDAATGELSAKLHVRGDGDVDVLSRLVPRGGISVEAAAHGEAALAAGGVVAVTECAADSVAVVVLPEAPTVGDRVTVKALAAEAGCPVSLEPHAASPAPINGWLPTLLDIDVMIVTAAVVELTYLGAAVGWQSRPADPVYPVGYTCKSFADQVAGLEDAWYWVSPDRQKVVRTYCKMSDGGWTLVESMSLASAQADSASFLDDRPTAGDLTLERFRLAFDDMSALLAATTRVRATCNMRMEDDQPHLQFQHAQLSILVFNSAGQCVAIESAAIVTESFTETCTTCNVWLEADGSHLRLDDATTSSCPDTIDARTTSSIDHFGHYANIDPTNLCTGSLSSTTQYWMK